MNKLCTKGHAMVFMATQKRWRCRQCSALKKRERYAKADNQQREKWRQEHRQWVRTNPERAKQLAYSYSLNNSWRELDWKHRLNRNDGVLMQSVHTAGLSIITRNSLKNPTFNVETPKGHRFERWTELEREFED